MPLTELLALAVALDELQRDGIDAVAFAGRGGAVVEDVAQVRVAPAAPDLDAFHAVATVGLRFDMLLARRRAKARPTTAGVELRPGKEQHLPATHAAVCAVGFRVAVLAGERRLGAGLTRDAVLFGREVVAPLVVGLADLVGHGFHGTRHGG